MATKKLGGDSYVNVAYLGCTLSAPNTLTFAKLDVITGALLGAKQYGMLIERAEFAVSSAAIGEMTTTLDLVDAAITVSNGMADISAARPEVIFDYVLSRHDLGVAASGAFLERPYVRDFTQLSGGGLLIPADRVFLGATSVGLASAATIHCRLYYTVVELDASTYLELLQSRSMLST